MPSITEPLDGVTVTLSLAAPPALTVRKRHWRIRSGTSLHRPQTNRELAAWPKNISNRFAERAACPRQCSRRASGKLRNVCQRKKKLDKLVLTSRHAETWPVALCLSFHSLVRVVPIRNQSSGKGSNLKMTYVRLSNRAGITQESPSTLHPDSHAETGNRSAPILAARRAPLPTMSPPFRPSPASARKPAP